MLPSAVLVGAKKAKKVPAVGVIRLRKLASDTGGPGFLIPAIKKVYPLRSQPAERRDFPGPESTGPTAF